MTRRSSELLEYHQGPPLLIEAMERWLSEDDRAEQADRVRTWIAGAYRLDPGTGPVRVIRKTAARRKAR